MLGMLSSSVQLVLVVIILVFAIFRIAQWFWAIPVRRGIGRMIEEQKFDEAFETLERAYERFIIRGRGYRSLLVSICLAQRRVKIEGVVEELEEMLEASRIAQQTREEKLREREEKFRELEGETQKNGSNS